MRRARGGDRVARLGALQPHLVVGAAGGRRGGVTRSYHALADGGDAGFIASTQHLVDLFRGRTELPEMDGDTAHAVLTALLTALESSARGVPLDVPA